MYINNKLDQYEYLTVHNCIDDAKHFFAQTQVKSITISVVGEEFIDRITEKEKLRIFHFFGKNFTEEIIHFNNSLSPRLFVSLTKTTAVINKITKIDELRGISFLQNKELASFMRNSGISENLILKFISQ